MTLRNGQLDTRTPNWPNTDSLVPLPPMQPTFSSQVSGVEFDASDRCVAEPFASRQVPKVPGITRCGRFASLP